MRYFRTVKLCCPTRARRGAVLVYSVLLMAVLLGVASLAMDYGRCQSIKSDLQRCADLTTRGLLEQYADSITPTPTTIAGWNGVDTGSGISPTLAVTWGWWNAATGTFQTGSGTPVAVQVVVSRTAAGGNAIPLIFPVFSGSSSITQVSCDVSATSIGYLTPATTSTTTVPATANIWMSGMPAGTGAIDADTTYNSAPTMAFNVTPGSVLTFSATGSCSYNSSAAYYGPDGMLSGCASHMQYSSSSHNGLQNGIQSITSPSDALLGVFLTNAAPNTVTPPAIALSYTTTATQNQNAQGNIQVQQPFLIGDGQTTSSVTQTFRVPANATRLFLGSFDQDDNFDNLGSFTVTTTQIAKVTLVK